MVGLIDLLDDPRAGLKFKFDRCWMCNGRFFPVVGDVDFATKVGLNVVRMISSKATTSTQS